LSIGGFFTQTVRLNPFFSNFPVPHRHQMTPKFPHPFQLLLSRSISPPSSYPPQFYFEDGPPSPSVRDFPTIDFWAFSFLNSPALSLPVPDERLLRGHPRPRRPFPPSFVLPTWYPGPFSCLTSKPPLLPLTSWSKVHSASTSLPLVGISLSNPSVPPFCQRRRYLL